MVILLKIRNEDRRSQGRMGWKAKYLKTVDREETTISFWQEIFDENGILVEVHEKYPIDKGHKKIEEP